MASNYQATISAIQRFYWASETFEPVPEERKMKENITNRPMLKKLSMLS